MVKLKGLFLSNFQSIKFPTYIKLAPITLLYGPNSSGKSAIFDALKWIKALISESNQPFHDRITGNYDRSISRNTHITESYREDQFSRDIMRVGLDIEIDKDENLESSIFTEILSTDGEFTVYHMLKAIRGVPIQLELSGYWSEFRLAVDSEPIIEALGSTKAFGADFKETDDDNYHIDFTDTLRINYKHKIFEDLFSLSFLSDLAKEGDGTILGMVLRKKDGWLEINGAGTNISYWENSYPVSWADVVGLRDIKFESWIKGEKRKKIIQLVKAEFDSKQSQDERSSAPHRIFSCISDLNLFLNALLQLINKGLVFGEIDGARSVLAEGDCDFEQDLNQENPLALYADYLTGSDIYPNPNITIDFPNLCIEKFLNGMNQYKFAAIKTSRKITNKSGEDDQPKEVLSPRFSSASFPIYLSNQLHRHYNYLYVIDSKSRAFSFSEIGSGFSYVAPILASLFIKPFTLVQQPELHLHPSAQCGLGDAFIYAAKHHNYSLVETHSEHLLLRILKRVREKLLKNTASDLSFDHDNICVYYFEPLSDGYTKVKRLRIDRHGEFIDRWPRGFFTERDSELFDE